MRCFRTNGSFYLTYNWNFWKWHFYRKWPLLEIPLCRRFLLLISFGHYSKKKKDVAFVRTLILKKYTSWVKRHFLSLVSGNNFCVGVVSMDVRIHSLVKYFAQIKVFALRRKPYWLTSILKGEKTISSVAEQCYSLSHKGSEKICHCW